MKRLLALIVFFVGIQSFSFAEEYGNKCRNLFELEKILEDHKELKVAVPDLHPLSHEEMYKRLLSSSPHFEELWREFCSEQKGIRQFITQRAAQTLKEMRKEIERAFSEPSYFSPQFEEWLKEKKGKPLIVRSSSIEDFEEISNAGGNESLVVLSGKKEDLSQAIASVLMSYFSEKSIGQLLILSEGEIPCPPVTLFVQEFIRGAKEDPVVSGIFFSEMPQFFSKNVSFIQSVYGPSALLASGDEECYDTYFVSKNGLIYSSIGSKREKNHPFSLSKEAAQKLKHLSDLLSAHYKEPIDIEWVYRPKQDMFFIVQARSLVFGERGEKASYVHPAFVEKNEVIAGEVIVCAEKEAIDLNVNNVLYAETIDKALRAYLFDQNKKRIRAVLIQKRAAHMSHPATIFRSLSIPVIALEDIETVGSWIESSEESRVILDIQQSCCINLPSSSKNVDVLISGICKNSLVLPLSIPFCSSIEPQMHFKDPDCSFEELFSLQNPPSHSEMKEVVEKIIGKAEHLKVEGSREKKEALNAILDMLYAMHEKMDTLSSADYELFFAILDSLLYQQENPSFINVFSLSQIEQKDHLERATWKELHRKALFDDLEEAWQDFVKDTESLSRWEQTTLEEDMTLLSDIGVSFEWLHERFYPLTQIPGISARQIVSATHEEVMRYRHVFHQLQKARGVTSKWESLIPAWEKKDQFHLLFNEFQKEFLPLVEDESLYKALKEKRSPRYISAALIAYFHSIVDCFDKTIKSLKGSRFYQTSDEMKKEQFFRVGKLIEPFFSLMERFFSFLSDSYFEKWSKTVFDEREFLLKDNMLLFLEEALEAHLQPDFYKKEFLPSPHFSVQGASVGSGCALFRSFTGERKATEQEAIDAVTLEDLFTLMHQNMCRILAIMYHKKASMSAFEYVSELKKVHKALTGIECQVYTPGSPGEMQYHGMSNPYLLSSEYKSPCLSFMYIHPMRHHSSLFSVRYDMDVQDLVIEVSLFGHNYEERMTKIKEYFLYSALLHGWELEQLPEYNDINTELKVAFKWTQEELLNVDDLMLRFCAMVRRAEQSVFFRDLDSDLESLQKECTEKAESDPETKMYLFELEKRMQKEYYDPEQVEKLYKFSMFRRKGAFFATLYRN